MSRYIRGSPISSLDEVMAQRLIYIRDKVYHIGWFSGWPVRLMDAYLQRGWICKAIDQKKLKNHKTK